MAQANDSVLVTPGTGATIATHLVNGKEYQVIIEADNLGHIKGSRDGWIVYAIPQTNAANRSVVDLFNADATAIVRVRGIWIIPSQTSITGVNIGFDINRTTSAGTGGTTITARQLDKNAAALSANITARYSATGGAALDYLYWTQYFFNDETDASIGLQALNNSLPQMSDYSVEIVLRQNQGIQVKQSVTATVGLTGALIYFVVE